MRLSLRVRLSLTFAVIGIVSLFSISMLVNFFIDKAFREYAIQKQQERNMELVTLISNQYLGENKWKTEVIQDLGVSALEEGLILKLSDMNNNTVWDAVQYNSGICQTMIDQMTLRMMKKYPGLKGSYTTRAYPVIPEFNTVGTLEIGYYGPFYYTDTELLFIDTFNRLLFFVTIITLCLALLAGIITSNMLSSPLESVIRISRKLTEGEYTVTEKVNTATKEIHELVETTKNLALTLDAQEKLRKRLTRDVSHELRTPLTTLHGQIEGMMDGVWDISQVHLKSCYEEIIRMSKLVNDMETLSHYDSESMKLEKREYNLNECIKQIIEVYTPQFAKKKITLTYTGVEIKIFADKDKLNQVLINLLANCIKFLEKDDKVEVLLKKQKDKLEIIFAACFYHFGVPCLITALPVPAQRSIPTARARSDWEYSSGFSGCEF